MSSSNNNNNDSTSYLPRIQQAFNQEHAALIKSQGWFYCDNFFPVEEALSIRENLLALDTISTANKTTKEHDKEQPPRFKEHMFQFGGKLFPKPNIYEIDLHDQHARERSKTLKKIYEVIGPSIVQSAYESLPELDLDPTQASSIKVQLNKGGSFPVHYDNPGPPSKRRLTCITTF